MGVHVRVASEVVMGVHVRVASEVVMSVHVRVASEVMMGVQMHREGQAQCIPGYLRVTAPLAQGEGRRSHHRHHPRTQCRTL